MLENLPPLDFFGPLYEFWYMLLLVGEKIWWLGPVGVIAAIYYIWLSFKRIRYIKSIEYILLAISVPEDNEKNPKSMEELLNGLWTIYSPPNFKEIYLEGESQESFSLEIVSIAGNVRFIIRVPVVLRDHVEANVYAQYPEAEISEVEDYVQHIPNKYPNDEYDLVGVEWKLEKEDAYPIRTYKYFVDDINEEKFIDPLSNALEVMNRIGDGEQIWYQYVLRPVSDKWKKDGDKLVDKLIKRKGKPYNPLFLQGVHTATSVIEPAGADQNVTKRYDLPSEMLYLSPGEQEAVKAIQENISKGGFQVKVRTMYLGRKDVFNKKKIGFPMMGTFKGFNSNNLNAFKPHHKYWTFITYWKKLRIPPRQSNLVRRYQVRDIDAGAQPFIMSVEELATVYHFPYISVKSPAVITAEAGKGVPPGDLPVE